MSQPYPPYYYSPDHDVYHWERACPRNWYPASGWSKSGSAPINKDRCAACEALIEFRGREDSVLTDLPGQTILIPSAISA